MIPTLHAKPAPGPQPWVSASRSVLCSDRSISSQRESGVFQGSSTPRAHRTAGELPHLVLDSAAPVGALVHRALVHVDQETRRRRTRGQPLLLTDPGEIVVVLARPVDVHPAGDAVPLCVRRLGSTLWAAHGAIVSGACSTAIPAIGPCSRDRKS